MFKMIRTATTREVYLDGKRVFLATIGSAWGECSEGCAERSMKEFLQCWGAEEDASIQSAP